VAGIIGAGQFAKRVLLPEIRRCGVPIRMIASATGISGVHAGRKFDAEKTTTDYREVLHDPAINVVFIATRHGEHAELVAEALSSGKHVFVEKPLAIDEEGLSRVCEAYEAHSHLQLMAGFNRRFAPHAVKVKELLAGRSKALSARILVNAGEIPQEHWANDPQSGGGRIVGEGCHFIDLLAFLVGSPICEVHSFAASDARGRPGSTATISLRFTDGSIGAVDYWCDGPRSFPKERVELFSDGRAVVIDNWRRLVAYEWPGAPKMRMRQDKGHACEIAMFLRRVAEGGEPLIPFDELLMVSRATLAAVQSVVARSPIALPSSQESTHPRPTARVS
jgi:predicted dehydrogenase